MKGKDRRHHHKTAQDGRKNGQKGNPAYGGRQIGLRVEVGPVGDHGAGAERERKEAKAHGIKERCAVEVFPARSEEKFHSGPPARQRHTADDEDHHQDE